MSDQRSLSAAASGAGPVRPPSLEAPPIARPPIVGPPLAGAAIAPPPMAVGHVLVVAA
jgi:hypothetical protein